MIISSVEGIHFQFFNQWNSNGYGYIYWTCQWIWIHKGYIFIVYIYWALSVCVEVGAEDGLNYKHEKLNVSLYDHRNGVHDRDWIHHMIIVGRCEIQAAFMTHQ